MSRTTDEIQRAKTNKIVVPTKLNDHDIIRGVYDIFTKKDDASIYIYIGRAYKYV